MNATHSTLLHDSTSSRSLLMVTTRSGSSTAEITPSLVPPRAKRVPNRTPKGQPFLKKKVAAKKKAICILRAFTDIYMSKKHLATKNRKGRVILPTQKMSESEFSQSMAGYLKTINMFRRKTQKK
jgi:hypothetical protein